MVEVEVGVEPPAPPAEVTPGLSPYRLSPSTASAKRSWPPGCGQSPSAAAGDGLEGVDGGTAVRGGREDEVAATVSPVLQNDALPQQQGLDKVEAVLSLVHNATPSRQGRNKVGAAVAPAAVSPVACNSALRGTVPESGLEKVGEDGDKGGNGEAQLLGDAGVPPLNGQVGNRVVKVAAAAVAAPGSCRVAGSAQDGGERGGLLVAEGDAGMEEVAGDGDVMEMGNSTGGGELARKQNGVAGSRTKRCLRSAANPLPKKRVVADETTATTKGIEVLEVSPLRTFPSISWRAAATTTDSGVLEVSPIQKFHPGCGKSALTTTGNGDKEGLPLEATPVSNGDAAAAIPISGGAASQTSALDVSNEKLEGKRRADEGYSKAHNGVQVPEDFVGTEQNKSLSTKKEVACSNVNIKQNKSQLSKFGKHVATNQISEIDDMKLVPDQLIVLALMAPDKCPWSGRRRASASKPLAQRNKLNRMDVTPRKLLINDETLEDNDDSNSEDIDNSKAPVMCGEKQEICVMVPPSVPSGSHQRQFGDHDVDARSKVRKLLQLFQATYRKLTRLAEQGKRNTGRVDLDAIKALKENPIYNKPGAMVGSIPGVEVGAQFHFRVELSLVGLHRPYQGGIDTSKVNGIPVAISIVASGGYPDDLSSSDELIYTGSGGKAGGNEQGGDQKLQCGNLALKNCIDTKTPVRVIHGFKGQHRTEVGHSKGKQTSTYIYDGLYQMIKCWQEGPKGEMVFKYKLHRIAGQPELAYT